MPWYADTGRIEEDRYYLAHADSTMTHWARGNAGENLRYLLDRSAAEIATREIVEKSGHPLLPPWIKEPETEDESFHAWRGSGLVGVEPDEPGGEVLRVCGVGTGAASSDRDRNRDRPRLHHPQRD